MLVLLALVYACGDAKSHGLFGLREGNIYTIGNKKVGARCKSSFRYQPTLRALHQAADCPGVRRLSWKTNDLKVGAFIDRFLASRFEWKVWQEPYKW
jgi:hypothetical protein